MSVSVVVFDMDDTLYLERDYVRSGLRACGLQLEKQFGDTKFEETAWTLFEEGERGAIIDRSLDLIGLRLEVGLSARLIEVYREHSPEIALEDDAEAALTTAQNAFDGMALLTDGRAATQRRKIDALNLSTRFDLIVVTDELGGPSAWKPNPVGFRMIESHFGESGASIVYLADNPAKDFLAPKELGWRTVRVRRNGALHHEMAVPAWCDAMMTVSDLTTFSVGELREYLGASG